MKTEVLSISSALKFKLSYFFCYKTKRKLTEYFSSVRRVMRKTVLCKYTRSSLESLHSMQSFNTFKKKFTQRVHATENSTRLHFFSNLFLIFCRLSNAGVVNSFLSILARKLYVRALRRRSTTVSLRKGPYGRVQLSRPSSQQQRSHFRLIYFYSFFLFLSYLLYTFLLYTFLFSHFCCTHFFSRVFCVRIFAIFGLLSRADILNRTEEKTLVLLVENQTRVFVIALDLVFTK